MLVDTVNGCEWKCHVVIGDNPLLDLLFIECFLLLVWRSRCVGGHGCEC